MWKILLKYRIWNNMSGIGEEEYEMAEKIKVIIADDEPRVCVVIQNCIRWEELGMELVGVAHNGKELLDQIGQYVPDIVITDISMPEINGMDLIEQTRKQNVNCRFIIISGYRQFEYAHKALKNNVDDYLLKPIDEQELNEALQKIKLSLIGERTYGREAVDQLIEHSRQNRRNMGKLFLNQMLKKTGKLDRDEIQEQYGIEFSDGIYQAAIAKFDMALQDGMNESISSIQRKLMSVFEKIFEDDAKEVLIEPESERILFGLYYKKNQGYFLDEKFRRFFEYGKNITDLFIGFSLTVGVSAKHELFSEFPDAFKEAEDAVCYRMTEGIEQVIFYDRIRKPERHYEEYEWNEILKNAEGDYEILNSKIFRHHLIGWFFVESKECNVPELVELSEELVRLFFRKQNERGLKIENSDYIEQLILGKIRNAISVSELKNTVADSISDLMEELEEEKKNQKKKPVRDALQFIADHYKEGISLETVAQEINLNPVYLSNIFKKETGENFVDYLHKYRIEAAKERLRREDTPIINIAMELGYSDAKYFSKIFKKYVGIKPTDYRKIYG